MQENIGQRYSKKIMVFFVKIAILKEKEMHFFFL
jgi:hypothetical protein